MFHHLLPPLILYHDAKRQTIKSIPMTKVYELINYKACSISVVHCGVRIPIEFVAGRGTGSNDNATFTTSSHFIMDALERDERYNKMYRCIAVHRGEKDNVSPASSPVAVKKGKRLSSAQKRALALNSVPVREKPIDATVVQDLEEEEAQGTEVPEEGQNPPKQSQQAKTGKGKIGEMLKAVQTGPVFKDKNEAFAFFVKNCETVASPGDMDDLLKKYNAKISEE